MSEDQQRVRDAAGQIRVVLGEVERGELVCSRAMRNRLEGAAAALDAVASGEPAAVLVGRLANERLRDGRS